MSVRFSEQPVAGEMTGKPVRLPYVLLCTQGERFCGWVRTANQPEQFVKFAAERRTHESSCQGGLIIGYAGISL